MPTRNFDFVLRTILFSLPLLAITRSFETSHFSRNLVFENKTCAPADEVFDETVMSEISCSIECAGYTECKSLFYKTETNKCYGCREAYATNVGLETVIGTQYFKRLADCGAVPIVTNAHVTSGISSVETSELVYGCDSNYKMIGLFDTHVTCLSDGSWTSIDLVCKIPTLGGSCSSGAPCVETSATCIQNTCFCDKLYRYNATINDCVQVYSAVTDTFTEYLSNGISNYNDVVSLLNVTANPTECRDICINDAKCGSYELVSYGDGSVMCQAGSITVEMALDADTSLLKSKANVNIYSRICN